MRFRILELQNQVTWNNVTLRVTNSKTELSFIHFRVTNSKLKNRKFQFRVSSLYLKNIKSLSELLTQSKLILEILFCFCPVPLEGH